MLESLSKATLLLVAPLDAPLAINRRLVVGITSTDALLGCGHHAALTQALCGNSAATNSINSRFFGCQNSCIAHRLLGNRDRPGDNEPSIKYARNYCLLKGVGHLIRLESSTSTTVKG
jgi:hypothetical protein